MHAHLYRVRKVLSDDMAEKEHVRKRRRLAWDVLPSEQPEEDVLAPVMLRNEAFRRHVSPPRREADREGHYVFSFGDNLTPRYKILTKMGEAVCKSEIGLTTVIIYGLKLHCILPSSFPEDFVKKIQYICGNRRC
ncbi:hypothetical protein RHMOL_Rhmol04G0157000 [Rhododendron molle]|uniref:Uncharacterized protein n=1 Tax=Rhododendron molle TaxID=49168 RepID=A0ACC0P176_RHOML|nr:hypothetical protein RHMOL_Rhmol04G0157000 [Rhododendron molle]